MTKPSEKYLVNKAWMTEKSQSSTVTDSPQLSRSTTEDKCNINLHQQDVTFKKGVKKSQEREAVFSSKIQQLTSPHF